MYLQAGSLFPSHWNRDSCMGAKLPMWIPCVCLCRAALLGQREHPARSSPRLGGPWALLHPHLCSSSLGKGRARREKTKLGSLRPPLMAGLYVMVSGIRHNLFRNKTKWVQNQIFKVSTSKANEWLKLGLIIDPSTCGSKVRPKLNNYFSEIIFD